MPKKVFHSPVACCSLKDLMYSSVTFTNLAILTD